MALSVLPKTKTRGPRSITFDDEAPTQSDAEAGIIGRPRRDSRSSRALRLLAERGNSEGARRTVVGPDQTFGAFINSACVDPRRVYRRRCLPLSALARAGVSEDVLSVLQLAAASMPAPTSEVTLSALAELEDRGLAPALKGALVRAWQMFEVAPDVGDLARGALPTLAVVDQAARPAGEAGRARAQLPDLAPVSSWSVQGEHLRLGLHSLVTVSGATSVRDAGWRGEIDSRPDAPALACGSLPPSSAVRLRVERHHQLRVAVPPEHRLLLLPDDPQGRPVVVDGTRRSIAIGEEELPVGRYRAVLLGADRVIEEADVWLDDLGPEQVDASAYFGFELVTPHGQRVGMRRWATPVQTEQHTVQRWLGVVDQADEIPSPRPTWGLPPGRYEGILPLAGRRRTRFVLDVLDAGTLEVTVGGSCVRLHRVTDRRWEGHLDTGGPVHVGLRFDPKVRCLSVFTEHLERLHEAGGWACRAATSDTRGVIVTDAHRTA